MKRKWKWLLFAAVMVGVIASIAGVALAGGPAWQSSADSGTGDRAGGRGAGYGATTLPSGSTGSSIGTMDSSSLSDVEESDLLLMREEEKLARDIYLALYEKWDVAEFSTIATSESRHMSSVEKLIDRYGLVDPVTSDAPGEFTNPELDAAYDQLLAQGLQSVEEAYKVGVAIEELDIADLDRVIAETTHSDISRVMQNLLRGSQNHLAAFSSLVAD